MNEQTPAPVFAIVPTESVRTKEMVLHSMRNALQEQEIRNLGVSRAWLVKVVEELSLTEAELNLLLTVRTDYGGKLVNACQFLSKGLTVQDVVGCYRIRQELKSFDKEFSASIIKLSRIIQTFPEADPESESLTELLVEAHHLVKSRYFWVHYLDQTMNILCAIATHHQLATIEAALSMIDSRQPKSDGVVNDDEFEEDEVEKHRTEADLNRKQSA